MWTFPHICVWGSCFWFCVLSPVRVRFPSSSAVFHTHTTLSHAISYNFVRRSLSHNLVQLCHTHNLFHTQLCNTHTHTQSLSHTTSSRTITHTTLSDTTLSRTIFRGHLFHILSHICFCVAGVALCDIDWSGLGTAGFVAGMALGDIDSSL